jgi:hypothetical protein
MNMKLRNGEIKVWWYLYLEESKIVVYQFVEHYEFTCPTVGNLMMQTAIQLAVSIRE